LSTNLLLLSVWCLGCGGPAPLTVDMPLHLEDHLDTATIEGSEVPEDIPEPVEWRFDEPQPEWRPVKSIATEWEAVEPVRVDDALRLPLTARNRSGGTEMLGVIYVDLPDWKLEDWAYVEIRARTRDPMRVVGLAFNYTEEDPWRDLLPFYAWGDRAPVVTDGTVQTYRLSLDARRSWEGPWTHLGIWFNSQNDAEAVTLDLLSVRVIPREADFAGDRAGVRTDRGGTSAVSGPYRRAVYTHAPGRITYRVKIPEEARLDVGLGVLSDNAPVTFAITATQGDGEVETLVEETYADRAHWGQRSVDLSHLAGQTVTLALETEAERAGTVALWGAPTLSGARTSDRPNIIFYVIDGAGADYMSVYGYNRRTTPNIERLAAEGAVFERAYSNSSWTRPSTASFMTSLQHSVLGGFKNGFNVIPDDAPTMAQHMHGAGYQTAVFTTNPNAGRMSGLERGVDFFRQDWAEFSYGPGGWNYGESSRFLHEGFWNWREAYLAEPFWVHFQTVDVHGNFPAVAPFGGLFVSPDQLKTYQEWGQQMRDAGGRRGRESYEELGLSWTARHAVEQGLYDEAMAHNDYQLGRLVERLKAEGKWENTLLIIGADHSINAAWADMGVERLDSPPPAWSRPMFRPSISRVPLIFVWPGHIPAGQRLTQTVSMIDVLPTILDLAGLPMPEVLQGQSLVPLLLGEEGWEPRPVILDIFNADGLAPNEYSRIEVVDGRWGASLEISPAPQAPPESRRPVPLLLYDLWNDPMCLYSLHEERPDLVEKYTAFLEAQWKAHQALAQLFTPSENVALTPEQLETLRALGYIQ
jgi:arylsulfatase A-like enzyme